MLRQIRIILSRKNVYFCQNIFHTYIMAKSKAWKYLKLLQTDFEKLAPQDFEELEAYNSSK